MSTPKITYSELVNLGACDEQLNVFRELFPSGEVEVTEELAVMHAKRFDWQWASEVLLDLEAVCRLENERRQAHIDFKLAIAEVPRAARHDSLVVIDARTAFFESVARGFVREFTKANAHCVEEYVTSSHTGMKVTYDQLRAADACNGQLEIFSELFPDGEVVLTEELAVTHAEKFDWNWMAYHLLRRSGCVWYHDTQQEDARWANVAAAIRTAQARPQSGQSLGEVGLLALNQARARDFVRAYLGTPHDC